MSIMSLDYLRQSRHFTHAAYYGRMSWVTFTLIFSICALIVAITALFVGIANFRALSRLVGGADSHDSRTQQDLPGSVHVICNPAKLDDDTTFIRRLSAMALDAGYDYPVFHRTTPQDPGGGVASEAVREHPSLVIVAGGDGTVRHVANALAHTGIPLGIVPLGTGNLLARNLSLPITEWEQACQVALTGKNTALDLGTLRRDGEEEEHPFLVIAGVGFDGDMMEGTSSDLKTRIGWGAYVLSGVKALRAPSMHVALSYSRSPQVHRRRARTLLFASCGQLTAGLVLLPGADPTDGWMEVSTIDVRGGLLGWGELAVHVIASAFPFVRHLAAINADMRTEKTTYAHAQIEGEARRVQVDGDPIGDAQSLDVHLLHHALIVRTI